MAAFIPPHSTFASICDSVGYEHAWGLSPASCLPRRRSEEGRTTLGGIVPQLRWIDKARGAQAASVNALRVPGIFAPVFRELLPH